jgi:hypothetical protein
LALNANITVNFDVVRLPGDVYYGTSKNDTGTYPHHGVWCLQHTSARFPLAVAPAEALGHATCAPQRRAPST